MEKKIEIVKSGPYVVEMYDVVDSAKWDYYVKVKAIDGREKSVAISGGMVDIDIHVNRMTREMRAEEL